ncbi:hypothetical protein BJX61DRAFT_535780 [Aspergillus egyptiacus]|nr:hypothetical protein BJX61DRAFT_535780 [Aspergillus egyptiacus]
MAKDQELISLAAVGKDLLSTGHFIPLDSTSLFAQDRITSTPRKSIAVPPNPEAYTFLPDASGWQGYATLADTQAAAAPELAAGQLIIGGAPVHNASLVTADQDDNFRDLAVIPVPVVGASGRGGSLLVAPVGQQSKQFATHPMLFLSAESDAHISFPEGSQPVPVSKVEQGLQESKGNVGTAPLDVYVLSGEIKNFFGIKGVTGKLYTYKSPEDDATHEKGDEKPGGKEDVEVDEKVMLDDMDTPLGVLFPEIDNHSLSEKEVLFPDGLRLNGDLELKDGLKFIADGLKTVFGSDKATKLPTKIRVSALLAKERDWSRKPKIEGLTLQTFLDDMKLPAWDFLEFQTVCLELSVRKEGAKQDTKDEKGEGGDDPKETPSTPDEGKEDPKISLVHKGKWKVGYGLSGKVSITKVPNSAAPLLARYWVRMGDWEGEGESKNGEDGEGGDGGEEGKEGKEAKETKEDKDESAEKEEESDAKDTPDNGSEKREKGAEEKASEGGKKYELLVKVDEWKDFCAISNLDMKEAQLHAFFKPGQFKESCTLSVTGSLEFAPGSLDQEKKEGEKKEGSGTGEVAKKEGDSDDEPKPATLTIEGHLSRDDYHFDAKVGDLKLDSILKIYAQITGAEPSKEAHGHDLVFEELHLNISRKLNAEAGDEEEPAPDGEKKAIKEKGEDGQTEGGKKDDEDGKQPTRKHKAGWSLELAGKVSFNNVKSVHGLVRYDSSGLAIQGGIEDYKIPDTEVTIKSASIDIFIGAKPRQSKDHLPERKAGPGEEKKADAAPDAEKQVSKSDSQELSKEKVAPYNRKSKFAIAGKVEFSGITVTVAFMTEPKEASSESEKASGREWVLYGVYGGTLRLKDMCPVMEGDLSNLELRNIALIAASGASQTVEELNTLKYPVKKGISLCATIPPLQELNGLAGHDIDGLVLVATIQKQELDLQIQLPASLDIRLTDSAKLTKITLGIEISKDPSLMVSSVLSILMESGQDPLLLEGMIKAGLLEASAMIETKSPWVNPFHLGKQVRITDFRVSLEITYVTLFETGPSDMGLAGELEVGQFTAGAAMEIGQHPDRQLISAHISKVDLVEIIRVAGEVAEIEVLKQMHGGEDTFVITNASLYLSTGTRIGHKEYPRGITAGGNLTAFGKSAEFHLSIGDAGLDYKGFVDNFSLGPLVVSSASGEPRASMIVVMTKDQQLVKLDGMVTCFGVGLVTLVNIQLGTDTPSFDAYIAVQFTKAFEISLQATVDDFKNVKDLAALDLFFHAQIRGDLFETICEGIKGLIHALDKLGAESIEAIQTVVGEKVAERQAELAALERSVQEAQAKTEEARRVRRARMDAEEQKRSQAQAEIDRLKEQVASAKSDKTRMQSILKAKVDRAERDKKALIQRKRAEYDALLRQAQADEKRYREQLAELQSEQAAKYGPDLASRVHLAQAAWQAKQDAIHHAEEAVDWAEGQLRYCHFWEKPYWAVKVGYELLYQQAQQLDNLLNSNEFRSLVSSIEEVERKVNDAANAVNSLVHGGGVDGFLKAFVDDEDKKIRDASDELHALENENSEYQKAIREAKSRLDKNGPGLEKAIAEADEGLKELKEDDEVASLKREYDRQKATYDQVHSVISGMQAGLEMVKKDWHEGMHQLEKVVGQIEQALSSVLHIESIEVGAHTNALVNNKPFTFTFHGTLAERRFDVEAEWAPGKALNDFYKEITNRILMHA